MKNIDMRRWLLVLICCLFCVLTSGQTIEPVSGKKSPLIARTDSSERSPKFIDKEKISEYKKDPDFIYTETPPAAESMLSRLWRQFLRWFYGLLDSGSSNPFVKYLVIIVGVGIVLYIVYRISRSERFFVSSGKNNELDYTVVPDNIHEINYEQEISQAISAANYRIAIRLMYLRTLKQLNDKGLIAWESNKTNFAYVNEVTSAEIKQPFRRLTHQFDYIWYGHFNIDEAEFKPIHQQFDHFKTMLR